MTLSSLTWVAKLSMSRDVESRTPATAGEVRSLLHQEFQPQVSHAELQPLGWKTGPSNIPVRAFMCDTSSW